MGIMEGGEATVSSKPESPSIPDDPGNPSERTVDTSSGGAPPEDVRCSLRAHGATQLQIKTSYPFEDRRRSAFQTNVYIIVPRQFSIRLDERGRRALLEDTQSATRFTVINMGLAQLVDPDARDSPLFRIAAELNRASRAGRPDHRRIDYEIRTFCNVFTFQIKSMVRFIRSIPTPIHTPTEIATAAKHFIRDAAKTLTVFRDIRTRLLDPSIPESVRHTHVVADEYVGDQFVRHLLDLAARFRDMDDADNIRRRLERAVERELAYQTERGYSAVRSDTISPGDERSLERLVVRESRLKKWVQSVLYMDVEESGTPRRVGHAIASVAAATAMSIAVVAAFFADRWYASYSVPWALLIVGSYILKDRIKEMLRSALVRYVPGVISDRTRILNDPATQRRVGSARLSIRSVDVGAVPDLPSGETTREDDILSETVARSCVMFSTAVRLNGHRLLSRHRRVNGITDITRIRLDRWLRDMDAPTKEVRLFVDRRHVTVTAPRTYRLQIAVRVSQFGERSPSTRFWTVVLTRTGIVRVEAGHGTREAEEVDIFDLEHD